MSKPNTITTIFSHNLWANQQLITGCAELSNEQLGASVTGTYGSIRDTLEHIARAEKAYLSRISTGKAYHRSPDALPWTIQEMKDSLLESGRGLIEWARRINSDDTVVLDWEGTQREVPKTVILMQAINHATEHRAQILTILTQLDITPPDLSGWNYFDSQS
jgi:uncharacterized damage-inducible protein DinB